MSRAMICGAAVVTILAAAGAAQQPAPATQAQQRPVFRGGTHFVRVDAYPVQDGKIVEGLKPEDFEILEDGKPQKIDSFDFVKFESFTPEAVRRDPVSQRDGFDQAADPRYRVFVIYVDMGLSKSAGAVATTEDLPRVQQPLINFLDRVIGPQDLYGFLSSRNSVKDLALARKTSVTVAQIRDLLRAQFIDRDEADDSLDNCSCGPNIVGKACDDLIYTLKQRYRADETYVNLRALIGQLGSLRQERKNVVFVSNLLPRWRPMNQVLDARGPEMPHVGIANGRVTSDASRVPGNGNGAGVCINEFQRLAMMDFEPRFREVLDDARRENVSFYTIMPGGLQAFPDNRAIDDLRSLASETDGVAVVNSNDVNAGFKRIADDLEAYYILGYYTTNTKFDGGLRSIKVRYKATGKPVRARRQYRAPTESEIAAMAASPSSASTPAAKPAAETEREAALTVLERANRPFASYAASGDASLTVVAELSAASIQAGRWKDGADVEIAAQGENGERLANAKGRLDAGAFSVAVPLPLSGAWPAIVSVTLRGGGESPVNDWMKLPPKSGTLVGQAVAYRAASRIAPRPVAAFEFARNERIRAEWPVLAPLDRREVRLLDRLGKPLPVELPLSEDPAKRALVLDMALSGIGRGDYLIELTAGSGATVERRLLAFRIKP